MLETVGLMLFTLGFLMFGVSLIAVFYGIIKEGMNDDK